MPEVSSESTEGSVASRRSILCFASADALGPRTDVMLSRLGYRMLTPELFDALRAEEPTLRPEMLVVDERRMDEAMAYAEGEETLPIVLLTGRQGASGEDQRVVGAVMRPAGLHDLYRLMQQVFEDVPRSTPRVATALEAHCESGGARWKGQVLSLSENGCLIRSAEAILLGQRLQLELRLPQAEGIEVEAEATYQLLPDTGLVFNALDAESREALGRFVAETILS